MMEAFCDYRSLWLVAYLRTCFSSMDLDIESTSEYIYLPLFQQECH